MMSKHAQRNIERKRLIAEVRAMADTIPEGKYATPGGRYLISKPTTVRHAGLTFLNLDDGDRVPGGLKAEHGIYAMIAADPRQAMLKYGRDTGNCGHCGTEVTDAGAGMDGRCLILMGWLDERTRL